MSKYINDIKRVWISFSFPDTENYEESIFWDKLFSFARENDSDHTESCEYTSSIKAEFDSSEKAIGFVEAVQEYVASCDGVEMVD